MTAIYKTGTVSVNNGSNIVTGSGTSFIDVANAQLGDLFTVDGQKFYEIYAVDTNTQIKIRNIVTGGAFAETNVTAGNFAIIRNFTSQTSAEIAGKVLAVQQKWMNREEEMTDWFYTANDWATVTSINGDELNVMTPNGINNLLAPGAFAPDFRTFGYGVDDLQDFSGDLNTLVTTGNYLAVSASTNTPSSIHAHYVQVVAANGPNSVIQYAQRKTSDQARQYTYMRQRENGVWSIWFPMSPQDYGLRNNLPVSDYASYRGVANSVDAVVETGFYSGFGGAHASATGGDNPFPTQNGAFTLEVQKIFNANGVVAYIKQVATKLESNINGSEIKFRTAATESSGWSGWADIYGSHNIALETYYVASGKTLKNYAIAQNPTTIDFDLEGFSTADPSSLTIEYGSFNIISNTDGTVVGSNITPTLAPTSTGRTPVARFTVSGAATGQTYRAVSVSGGARFKINWA